MTWNLDPELLEQELSSCAKKGNLPKAVIPTDLYGQCVDLDRILKICEPYNIPVVIDSAEALGATYKNKPAGIGAKAAIFSFNGNKIITTSGGGMLVSEDKSMIDHARFLSTQARDPFPHYEHSEIGYNYRMSNIVAAIGRGQLRVLDERVKVKRAIFKYYQKALNGIPGIEFMPEASYGHCSRWLTVLLINPEEFGADRETVRLALEAENIEARPVWKPMHLQPVFRSITKTKRPEEKQHNSKHKYFVRVVGGNLAEELYNKGLCLPSGTTLTNKDLDHIISLIIKCRK
jgi:dTDP-4-amino-4,6-dideoxygalactose transaminase